MSAIIGVVLIAAAAALFVLFRVVFPDRPGETPIGELSVQMAGVLMTGLFAGGVGALIDFAARHDNPMGYVWLVVSIISAIVLAWLATRLGKRAQAA